MKVGIIGLPQVGKKTLFEILTGEKITAEMMAGKNEVKLGAAKIRDERFEKLVATYKPKRVSPAMLDVVLLPKFDKETLVSGECLKAIEKCQALCHIVRAFDNEAVFHIDGTVDPLRDIEKVYTELILSDLILIEKRLERLQKEVRIKSDPQQIRENEILTGMKALLDENKPLIGFSLSAEDKKLMSTYQFLTQRPLIIVLNMNEDKLSQTDLLKKVEDQYGQFGVKVMQISAKIEAELNDLPPEEQEVFLEDLNIKESALNLLSRLCFQALGLISFFTVGENEVHQWTVRAQSTAWEAAGAIHSDIQRGFIRAEIFKYDDLIEMGSEAALKQAGKVYLKGKDYVMEDGDIMFVRFNV